MSWSFSLHSTSFHRNFLRVLFCESFCCWCFVYFLLEDSQIPDAKSIYSYHTREKRTGLRSQIGNLLFNDIPRSNWKRCYLFSSWERTDKNELNVKTLTFFSLSCVSRFSHSCLWYFYFLFSGWRNVEYFYFELRVKKWKWKKPKRVCR